MRFIDYYAVMEVSPDATPEEIKKAYRRLARRYHPDVSKETDAEERFKALGEAYEVLKDPDKRVEYDRLRSMGSRAGENFAPPPGWNPRRDAEFSDAEAADFSEFFEAIFGQRDAGRRRPRAGDDLHHEVQVSLEESLRGGTRMVTLGAPAGSGAGAPRTLKFQIPEGVRAGQKIRLRGQGHPGLAGGPAGDLYLHVEFAPHPLFVVEGNDLALVLPVTPWEAVLGAAVTVPTLHGAVKLNVPAGSQAGQRLRLQGKGLGVQPRGDLLVTLRIVVPTSPSKVEQELFERLARESGFNPRVALGV
jgi:curved DNA-binding protein